MRTALLLLSVLLCSCGDDANLLFTRLDESRTGINFKNTLREDESANVMNYLYFYNGGGVAVGDINNDGLPDLLFTGNMVPNRLYLNKGNFKFEDITERSGIATQQGWCTGASMVDINNDGLLDIYICRSADVIPQRRQNLLFINQGEGKFTEQAMAYGLADQGYSTQAAFLDYDRDGDLDMFLINHSQQQYAYGAYENTALRKQQNDNFSSKLFRNDGGYYTDVSKQSGIVCNVLSFGLGLAISDVNKDGWPDVYVSNDFNEPDYLYINNRDGTFTERLKECMDQVSLFSMGSDCADINNDGLPDLVTLDMLPEDNYMQKMHSGAENFNKFQQLFKAGFFYQYSRNMMHLNNGDGTFSEVAQAAGVSNTDWSWAPLLADLDNDGHRDLFITNGYARDYTNMDFMKYRVEQMGRERSGAPIENAKTLLSQMPSVSIANYAYRQDSGGVFTNQAASWGLGEASVSSGAAYADLDGDGDLDLVINNINSEASVYKNNCSVLNKASHYLRVKLQGPPLNRNGIGTAVTVYAGGGMIYTEQQPVRGFESSVEPVLHVGLGKVSVIDSMRVLWPDGKIQMSGRQPVDTMLVVKWEEDAKAADANAADAKATIAKGAPTDTVFATKNHAPIFRPVDIIDYTHHENQFNDFTVQSLLPAYLSRSGPCMAKADVNRDGREDLYIGGAAGQAGSLYLQSPDGTFTISNQQAFAADALSEDTRSVFFDADNDGDQDLYVASGGYEFAMNDPLLQDRLYLNDGSGHFMKSVSALPVMTESTGAVAEADIDRDGDMDLFVGGRVVPGRYPESPRSYLLINDGKGKFSDATQAESATLLHTGMVTDAVFTDVNLDGAPDLVVVGEFMPIRVMINHNGKLYDETGTYVPFASSGCWNRILAADLDGDGDEELVIGNMGVNGQLKATAAQPVTVWYKDYDGNGSVDPILHYYIDGVSYPAASRDDLAEQLPMLNKKYLAYATYANATTATLFTPEQSKGAQEVKAELLETILLENDRGKGYKRRALPVEVQYAPIYAMQAGDADGDGIKDLVLAGNQAWARIKLGRFRANHGLMLKGMPGLDFRAVPQFTSGFTVRGDTRDLLWMNAGKRKVVIFGVSDEAAAVYEIR